MEYITTKNNMFTYMALHWLITHNSAHYIVLLQGARPMNTRCYIKGEHTLFTCLDMEQDNTYIACNPMLQANVHNNKNG